MSLRLPPVGFWSYATQDDQKKLSELRLRLSELLQRLYGREHIGIFQDVFAIAPGAEWEEKIRDALNSSSFFIPIITPNFLESEWCNKEFFEFRNREEELLEKYPKLKKQRLIFPIYYIDTAGIKPLNPNLLIELNKLQRLNFEDLVFKGIDDEQVQMRLDRLARSLRTVLHLELETDTPTGQPSVDPVQRPRPAVSSPAPRARLVAALAMAGVSVAAALAFAAYEMHSKPEPTQPADRAEPPPAATSSALPVGAPAGTGGIHPAAPPVTPRPQIVSPISAAADLPSGHAASLAAVPGGNGASLPLCLTSIVAEADAAAAGAHKAEGLSLTAAKRGKVAADQERALHPNAPSAPRAPDHWSTPDGDWVRYWGETVANAPNGYGVMEYENGDTHSGQFRDGHPDGFLVYKSKQFEKRSVYTKNEGTGPAVYISSTSKISGDMLKNQFTGYITVTFSDKSTFKGQVAPGNGGEFLGAVYTGAGKLLYSGFFKAYDQAPRVTTDCVH